MFLSVGAAFFARAGMREKVPNRWQHMKIFNFFIFEQNTLETFQINAPGQIDPRV